MKIAIAALLSKKIEAHPMGGTERFTYLLTEGLVKKGHEVRIYCAKGSQTSARQIEICSPEDATGTISNVEVVYPYTILQIKKIISDIRDKKIEILHINFLKSFLASFYADDIAIPIVHTIHRDFFGLPKIFEIYKKIGFHNNEHYVFVSKNAKNSSLLQKNCDFIYNGINIEEFPFSEGGKSESLLWASRIDPLKGPKESILAVKNLNVGLTLSGNIDRKKYQDYFDQEIKPLLNDHIKYEPGNPYPHILELYQNSKALLFPIQWEEPFGYVMVESMACGTPVIAYARGSVPEIIKDGVTGFIVNSSPQDIRGDWIIKSTGIEGLKEAIKRIIGMPTIEYLKMRKASRQHVETNFTINNTIGNYEKFYQNLLKL